MEKKTLTEFIRYCFIGADRQLTILFILGYYSFFKSITYLPTRQHGYLPFSLLFMQIKTLCLSKNSKKSDKEALSFFSMRLVTLLIENVLLYICIQQLLLHSLISKLAVSVITVLANYVLCKYAIFTEEKGGIVYEEN